MNILNIFYENIIPEASVGRVNSYFYYNIMFSTNLVEDNKFIECKEKNENVLIPTLIIKNKSLFDQLLVEYVTEALKFYNDDNFCEEILDYKMYDKDKICKEKTILATLFSNATLEDFNDPINFLKNRINFIKNNIENNYDLGYCDILKSNISLKIERDIIENETPFKITIIASNENDEYTFPSVKFGISDNKVYIYAIQNSKDNVNKKINRILYKIGEGFNDDYTEENLKDVTASFLVTLNFSLALLKNLGYSEIIVPSILIERWNSKAKANVLRSKRTNNLEELENKQLNIQENLTNKLIRTFLRLKYHYEGVDILSYPSELDNNLSIKINDMSIGCNNKLLNETQMLVSDNFESKKKL